MPIALIAAATVGALALAMAAVSAVYAAEQKAVAAAEQHTPPPTDIAVVLGNAVNRRGRPNPCLRNRVEAGVWLYRAGKTERLLMSGGYDGDGSNQAESMREMALNLGVPPERILLENQSESTYENIVFSAPLLRPYRRIAIVSDGFHVARGRWLAGRHWQGKEVSVFAAGSCGDSDFALWRKRIRETLAWGKGLVFDR